MHLCGCVAPTRPRTCFFPSAVIGQYVLFIILSPILKGVTSYSFPYVAFSRAHTKTIFLISLALCLFHESSLLCVSLAFACFYFPHCIGDKYLEFKFVEADPWSPFACYVIFQCSFDVSRLAHLCNVGKREVAPCTFAILFNIPFVCHWGFARAHSSHFWLAAPLQSGQETPLRPPKVTNPGVALCHSLLLSRPPSIPFALSFPVTSRVTYQRAKHALSAHEDYSTLNTLLHTCVHLCVLALLEHTFSLTKGAFSLFHWGHNLIRCVSARVVFLSLSVSSPALPLDDHSPFLHKPTTQCSHCHILRGMMVRSTDALCRRIHIGIARPDHSYFYVALQVMLIIVFFCQVICYSLVIHVHSRQSHHTQTHSYPHVSPHHQFFRRVTHNASYRF